MSFHTLILDSIMNQIISSVHQSNIINLDDMEQAIRFHPLLGSIVSDMQQSNLDNGTNYSLHNVLPSTKEAKHESKKYNKYVFTDDALNVLQNLYDYISDKYPTRASLEKRFPFLTIYISQMYVSPKQTGITNFIPKLVEIDTSKPLYHTTNAFEVFEMNDRGTPYGPAWLSIDTIFDPEKVKDFHPMRGGLRVIKYKWIPSSEIDFTTEYPFIDVQNKSYPRIMDARKLKKIPAGAIEKYFETNGMIMDLPKPDLDENILMTYGKMWRPVVLKFLESKGIDGVLTKQNEIVLFHPERWITFENIEQGDMLYSALIEALKIRKTNLIEDIASKYNVDSNSLFILYNQNLQNIP